VVAPRGALYAFPSVRRDAFADFDDNHFALELLERADVLIVPGSGFNVADSNHFRVTLLPRAEQLRDVFSRIETTLQTLADSPSIQRHVA
jgi:alanine-synthesizing transaminase